MKKIQKSSSEKLSLIEQFYYRYLEASKKRPKMYGSVSELESNWRLLDDIYFVLENIPEEKNYFRWSDFLVEKGFGSMSFDIRAKERRIQDPYSELVKLRNEYEEWREKSRKMKEFQKPKKFLTHSKDFNPKGFWFEKRNH